MKKGVFKPKHTVHVQYQAHQEVEAITDKGKIYLHYPSTVEGDGEEEEERPTAPTRPEATRHSTPTKEVASTEAYTEDALMEMDVKTLEGICKDLGVDPSKKEGKNTNKKLRLLILEAQESGPIAPTKPRVVAEEEEGTPAPRSRRAVAKDTSAPTADIARIVKDLDTAEINESKAIAQICDLGDVDKKAVTKIIDKMMSDTNFALEDVTKQISALFSGEESPEASEAPKKKKGVVEDWDTLEEGDDVKVFWKAEDDYFTGEVKSKTAKGILVLYDDGEEEFLNEKYHTEVIRK